MKKALCKKDMTAGQSCYLLLPKYFLPNKDKSWQTTQVAEGS
jgi:hypothetical protein